MTDQPLNQTLKSRDFPLVPYKRCGTVISRISCLHVGARRLNIQKQQWVCFNDFAHIPWEDTPNFPKPPQRKIFPGWDVRLLGFFGFFLNIFSPDYGDWILPVVGPILNFWDVHGMLENSAVTTKMDNRSIFAMIHVALLTPSLFSWWLIWT